MNKIIAYSFLLAFPEKEQPAGMDDIVPIMITIVNKAQLQNPFSIEKYLKVFQFNETMFDQ